MMAARDLQFDRDRLRQLNGGHVGVYDVACPLCGPDCRTPSNRTRKVLRIWDDGDFITYKCARCDVSGWAKDAQVEHLPRREPKAEATAPDRSELARWLWSKSQPLAGSFAAAYLRSRFCFIDSPNIRCLPAHDKHPPAMIARFGEGAVTSVHLTKLKADGSGKAGTDNDKIVIGPSIGQPIIMRNNLERGELIIAEGIEDAASLVLCVDWNAWAAGTAGRIAAVVAMANDFDRVFVAIDLDKWKRTERGAWIPPAAEVAFAKARAVRSDIIPVRIAKALGRRDSVDANKALIQFGREIVAAVIEWSFIQDAYARGHISFGAMERESAAAQGVFNRIAGDRIS